MADNSPSLRAQPEDECAIIAIISKVMRYNYFISYIATSVQQQRTKLNSDFHCYKYLFLLLSSDAKILSLGNDRTLSPYCKTIFLQPHKKFNRSHTDIVLVNYLSSDRKDIQFNEICQVRG